MKQSTILVMLGLLSGCGDEKPKLIGRVDYQRYVGSYEIHMLVDPDGAVTVRKIIGSRAGTVRSGTASKKQLDKLVLALSSFPAFPNYTQTTEDTIVAIVAYGGQSVSYETEFADSNLKALERAIVTIERSIPED